MKYLITRYVIDNKKIDKNRLHSKAKAFLILRRMMGKSIFDTIVKTKIIPIAGDIISPDLSMSEQDREKIIENVQVVIHCAATLNYNERLDLALEVLFSYKKR